MPEKLPNRVLGFIRKHALLHAGDRVGIAVSGGADSVALLRLVFQLRGELGIVLSAVHFNHHIRGEASNADERFVRELAQISGLDCHVSSSDVPAEARSRRLSLETAARELRYEFFRSLIEAGTLDKIATAHTLDDQAETVLLRIIRGSGTGGLAGIYPRMYVERLGGNGAIVRPFLKTRRDEIERYLNEIEQCWRDDATNLDLKHTRNRVRHTLLPLLETQFNPLVRERLAEMADIARAEAEYMDDVAAGEAERIISRDAPSPSAKGAAPAAEDPQGTIRLDALAQLPLALQRRVIRYIAASRELQLDFGEVERVLALTGESPSSGVELHDGWEVNRGGVPGRRMLVFQRHAPGEPRVSAYEYVLRWPGEVRIAELGLTLRARLVDPREACSTGTKAENASGKKLSARYNRSQLLDPHKLTSSLTIRNWRPGDRYWPAHTGGPRKIKELLQQQHVTGAQRTLWPVIVSGNEVVWMRGAAVPDRYLAGEEEALTIEEVR